MALSRVIRTGNGTTTQFVVDFALGYLDQDDVTARVGDEVDGAGNPVYRTITFLSDTLMQISGPPAGNGVRVVFERTVEKEDTLVHFSNGDVMDEENLDLSFKQILMVVHEVLDGRFGQFDSDLDMGSFLVRNAGDPVDAGDLTTKRYVDARISTGQASATAAAASAAAAASSAASAASSVTASAGSATTASNAAATSTTNSENSYKWASEAEDVPVNDGTRTGYSAYHWCRKAELAAGGGVSSWAGLTGTISKAEAQAAIDLGDYVLTTTYNTDMAGKAETDLSNVTQAVARSKVGTGTNAYRNLTVSTGDPAGGADGDVHFKV